MKSKPFLFSLILLGCLAFLIPIEHKYDKLFRFYSLTLIPEGTQVSSLYEKKLYFYISDFLALFLGSMGIFWRNIPLKRFFGNLLWLVFFCSSISIVASPFWNYPVAYSRLVQLLTPILLFSTLAHAYRKEEKLPITQIVLTGVFAASLFQTFTAILQYFHQGTLGLRLFGETSEKTVFVIQGGARWIFDSLSQVPVEIMRASGTLPHANVLGGFLLFSLFAGYFFWFKVQRKWPFTLLFPFQLFALALSYSRSALFGWALGTGCFFVLLWTQKSYSKKQLFHFGSLIFASFVLCSLLLFPQYRSRGGVISTSDLSSHSDHIRKVHQQTAWEIIKEVPWTGLGFGQFSEHSQKHLQNQEETYVRRTAPHNIFLFLACETGLISSFALALFCLLLISRSLRSERSLENSLFLSLFLSYCFISFCDFYPLLFQQGKLMFFFTAGLLYLNTNVCKPFPSVIKRSAVEGNFHV